MAPHSLRGGPMAIQLKVIDIDGEAGVILPDEIVAEFNLKAGDTLIATPEGGHSILLQPEPSPPND
jgi:antitoxin component of MazEF toxin-antitoxin module